MPKAKRIAYKKCSQCRNDKQKCLPESRIWPGTKCERCERYGYPCSAMRTKHEESSMTSDTTTSSSVDLQIVTAPPPTTPSSPQARRSEIRCLQDLGDLRLLFASYPGPLMDENCGCDDIVNSLRWALDDVVQKTVEWARQHEAEGRYRDAEYLFRQVSSNKNIPVTNIDPYQSKNVLPNLVSIYENMADYPTAERAQEALLRQLFAKDAKQISREQIQAVFAYSRLLSSFQLRVVDLKQRYMKVGSTYVHLFVTYRAAVLDNNFLNEVLVDNGLIPLESKYGNISTPLHIAARENAIGLARVLIENGADVNTRDFAYRTPLHIAARYAETEMTELLLANDADANAVGNYSITPLHEALYGRLNPTAMACLINAGADINALDTFESTPLNIAIERDQSAVTHSLLEQGANIEGSSSSPQRPLVMAVEYKREWAVRLLVERGADLVGKSNGDTALYVAVKMAQESLIRILLDHGAMTKITVDQQNPDWGTVLQCAIQKGNVAILEMLLQAGADLRIRDWKGRTALHQAVIAGQESHEHILRLLLEHSPHFDDVDVVEVDIDNATVLHLAVKIKRRNMLLILIQHIRPEELLILCQLRDKDGLTPLDIARSQAAQTSEASVEKTILYLLENALIVACYD